MKFKNLAEKFLYAPRNYYAEIGEGTIEGKSFVHKFGRNPNIPNAATFEALWNKGDTYTGFDCVVAETLETFSSLAADTGTLLSSGTLTADGGEIYVRDSSATFISDGVAAGDIVINDTSLAHSIIKSVNSETEIETYPCSTDFLPRTGEEYRVATTASTGAAVVRLDFLLDGDLLNETSEYIILNGVTGVDTVGTYMRHARGKVVLGATKTIANAGSLTTRQKITTANITMFMPIGFGSTMVAGYTIPADKRGRMLDWFASLAGKTSAKCDVQLCVAHRGQPFRVLEHVSIGSNGSSFIHRPFRVPKNGLSPGTDIVLQASSDTNSTAVSGSFDLVLKDV